jgi:hypothetical protein
MPPARTRSKSPEGCVAKWSQLPGLNRRPTVYKFVVIFSSMRKHQQMCAFLESLSRMNWQV